MIFFKKSKESKFDEGYDLGYQDGVNAEKRNSDALVEKLVADRYAERHWTVNPNNVLYVSDNSGLVFLGREQLTAQEVKSLKEEVDYFKTTRLYKIFNETIRQQAIEIAVMKSKDFEQVITGKSMVHNLGIINWIVERIDKARMPN